jgi:hypothetical protein
MKTLRHFACALVLVAAARAQFRAPAGDFENPAILNASEVLPPSALSGPLHRVRDEVTTASGLNHYVVESELGSFEVDGTELLFTRIHELAAIVQLRETSRRGEYKVALEKAARAPAEVVRSVATDPVKTIANVSKGVGKFISRTSQAVKEVAKRQPRNPYEDSAGESMIGFSKAKRDLAARLGVDPYSTNEMLQRELNGVAWTAFAGSSTVDLLLAPLSGPAGAAATAFQFTTATTDALRDLAPDDLRRMNRGRLLKMKVPAPDAETFIVGTAFSPRHQTLFVDALARLDGVRGRDLFVQTANENSQSEGDAIFCQRTAELLAGQHRGGTRLAKIQLMESYPVAVAASGDLIVALQWDYAAWTAAAAEFVAAAQREAGSGKVHVTLSGTASVRLREELKTRGIALREGAGWEAVK